MKTQELSGCYRMQHPCGHTSMVKFGTVDISCPRCRKKHVEVLYPEKITLQYSEAKVIHKS